MTRRCVDCGAEFRASRDYYVRCWDCWHDQRGARTNSNRTFTVVRERTVPAVPSELIRAAIGLAHPDRHPPERQESALRVTQQLTDALERTRRLEQAA